MKSFVLVLIGLVFLGPPNCGLMQGMKSMIKVPQIEAK